MERRLCKTGGIGVAFPIQALHLGSFGIGHGTTALTSAGACTLWGVSFLGYFCLWQGTAKLRTWFWASMWMGGGDATTGLGEEGSRSGGFWKGFLGAPSICIRLDERYPKRLEGWTWGRDLNRRWKQRGWSMRTSRARQRSKLRCSQIMGCVGCDMSRF